MKSTFLRGLLVCGALAAGPAMAAPIPTDAFWGKLGGNSGNDELGMFQTAFGSGVTGPVKKVPDEDNPGGPLTLKWIGLAADGSDAYEVGGFSGNVAYFLLKLGVGGSDNKLAASAKEDKPGKPDKNDDPPGNDALDSYLFKNDVDLGRLTFSSLQVDGLITGSCGTDGWCELGRLSHLSWIPGGDGGGDPGSVPEPASLALIGAGLAGLGLRRRRR